jgi:NAD(P)-dependent dehydrogenase (short-subunit alcohol dehydrogenase family)
MGKKILLTGGAGFIGSNIADALIGREDVDLVRVLDNLATGKMEIFSIYWIIPSLNLSKVISVILILALQAADNDGHGMSSGGIGFSAKKHRRPTDDQ